MFHNFILTLRRNFGELITDCSDCTDKMTVDSGPSVSIRGRDLKGNSDVALKCRLFDVLVLLIVCALPATASEITNSIGQRLTLISAGEFVMGSPKDYADAMSARVKYEWYRDSAPSEWPQRRVRISKPFFMGTYEVTLRQFRQFVTASGYVTDAERDGKGGGGKKDGKWIEQSPEFNWRQMGYERTEDEPVVNVSWNDAVAFSAWLSKREGAKYRLPTEAEWEYACRAGTTAPAFWGSDDLRRKEFAWSGDNSGGRPRIVGQLKPNGWGLHDILGNVYEYCADGWSTNITAALGKSGAVELTDPVVPLNDEIVVRSTSWGTNPLHCRSAFRGSASRTHRNHRDGFRMVRESSGQ